VVAQREQPETSGAGVAVLSESAAASKRWTKASEALTGQPKKSKTPGAVVRR
jgi:hypothetical protein